jgi:hypothetical protein
MAIHTITFQATDNADYYRLTLAGPAEARVLARSEHALARADAIRAEWAHVEGLKSREKIAALIQQGAEEIGAKIARAAK